MQRDICNAGTHSHMAENFCTANIGWSFVGAAAGHWLLVVTLV